VSIDHDKEVARLDGNYMALRYIDQTARLAAEVDVARGEQQRLLRQLEALRRDRDSGVESAGFWGRATARVLGERDTARRESDRMRPVFEAAVTWGRTVQRSWTNEYDRALLAALAAATKETK